MHSPSRLVVLAGMALVLVAVVVLVLVVTDPFAGSTKPSGAPTLFLGLPDISTRTNKPVWGAMAPEATLDQAP